MKNHILSVQAQNKPGVLSKITGLLRRKCFQIDSLTAGTTQNPEISQLTIVISGDISTANQASYQLEKIIEVISSKVLKKEESIVREIVLARLKPHNDAEEKKLLVEVEKIFHKELYRNNNEVCIELIDATQGLDNFLEKIHNANIEVLEWVRSGVIAIKDTKK